MKSERLIVETVEIVVGKCPFPVAFRFVSGGVHPHGAPGDRPLCDIGDRSGSIVEIGVVPAKGVVDDIDAIVQAVGDGEVEIDLVCDLDQVKLRIRGDLVQDFCNSGPMSVSGGESGPGQVMLMHGVGYVAACLRLGKPGKTEVDDRHLHPASGDSSGVEGIRPDRCHSLARYIQSVRDVRWADKGDPAQLRGDDLKQGEGHTNLDQAGGSLDRGSAHSKGGEGGNAGSAGPSSQGLKDHSYRRGRGREWNAVKTGQPTERCSRH